MPIRIAPILLALGLAFAPSAAGDRPVHVVPRVETAPSIDGRLAPGEWDVAATLELGVETYPAENVPAAVRTTCLVAHDDDALYVAFRAFDPDPEAIRAHLADRDSVSRNDLVGFVLDTFDDGRRGYVFMVNPLGVQMDGLAQGVGTSRGIYPSLSGAPGESFAWDAIWESAGSITADGYVVEIAIPFQTIRFPPGGVRQSWGFSVFRSYPRVDRQRFQTFVLDRDDACVLCQADRLVGLEGLEPGRDIEINPTLTSQRRDERETLEDPELSEGDVDTDFGVTGRWGITPSLSLAGTINPDFSQVEADAARLDINERFTLFFPEKRPFFLDGASFFDSPINAIYTRTVADPSWGVKLSGKEGPHAIGAYVARDRGTTFVFPGNQGSSSDALESEPYTGGVLRYRGDVGRASNLGVVLTDREGENYHNRVYGGDGSLQMSDTDAIAFQVLRSETRYPEAVALANDQPLEEFEGTAAFVRYRHTSREWFGQAQFSRRDPDFRADSGFVTRVDFRTWSGNLERTVWGGDDTWFDRLRFELSSSRTDDDAGVRTDESTRFAFKYNGPWQSYGLIRYSLGELRFAGETFDTDNLGGFVNVRPTGDFTASLGFDWGNAVDFVNARPARRLNVRPGITLNVGRHLYIQLDHTFEQLEVDDERLFRANIAQGRFVYQFTTRTFVRAILQYVAVRRNLGLYEPCDACPPERDRSLLTELLFSYKINPRTLVFVGYSDTRQDETALDLTVRNRTFFVKLAYAWLI